MRAGIEGEDFAGKKGRTHEDPEQFISVRECAALLRVSEVTVRRYLWQKRLKRYKVCAGRTLVKVGDALALIREA